ncbi:MAG: gliding motility-associated ABC transporter ATP-binding subunit GldA [Bacteroidota bacterium]
MSVKVSDITKIYGKQRALDKVSFEVHPGDILGFLGPNGAGKSTMMKIITCFLPQTEGTATVCGHNVMEAAMEVKKCVGYLPENNPLYHDMYIKEYLEFIAGVHGIRENKMVRVKAMIDITGLGLEQNKKIGALSKGYRQRVGLAQALIHDPQVLILDEPTSGLDPNQLVEIRNLIKNIGKEKTVIFSTHIMQEVTAICNRVIIINRGKLVADDPIESLKSHVVNKNIISVEFDNPTSKISLKKVQGVLDVDQLNSTNFKIYSDSETDIRKELFNYAIANDLAIITIKKEEQNLEEIFKSVTQNE